jgi:flagellar motility protein MotE (MotC chaperone)
MKNFLILGVLALFLFSVSAGLSLWLNQAKTDATAEKEKVKDGHNEKEKGHGPKELGGHDPIVPKSEGAHNLVDVGASLNQREDKLKYRTAQMDVVLRDLQVQREATDATLNKVLLELKNVGTEAAKLEKLTTDLTKGRLEVEASEKKNIDKLATVYDSLAPESAAPLLKEMAEKGQLDMAAKILFQMKERNAARVLEAMNDPSLEFQIVSRIRTLKAPAPVVPAKGP